MSRALGVEVVDSRDGDEEFEDVQAPWLAVRNAAEGLLVVLPHHRCEIDGLVFEGTYEEYGIEFSELVEGLVESWSTAPEFSSLHLEALDKAITDLQRAAAAVAANAGSKCTGRRLGGRAPAIVKALPSGEQEVLTVEKGSIPGAAK